MHTNENHCPGPCHVDYQGFHNQSQATLNHANAWMGDTGGPYSAVSNPPEMLGG